MVWYKIIYEMQGNDRYATSITGVVLAGGKSQRMGSDKATLKIGSSFLIEYPLKVLIRHFNRVMVVTNSRLLTPLRKILDPTIWIVEDIYPDHGALGGIYTALSYTKTPYIFVTACDMPFLNDELVTYMAQLINGYDVIIPKGTKGFETLHAIYKKTLLKLIRKNLMENKNKIKEMFSEIRILSIPDTIIKKFEENEKMFININTLKELNYNFS